MYSPSQIYHWNIFCWWPHGTHNNTKSLKHLPAPRRKVSNCFLGRDFCCFGTLILVVLKFHPPEVGVFWKSLLAFSPRKSKELRKKLREHFKKYQNTHNTWYISIHFLNIMWFPPKTSQTKSAVHFQLSFLHPRLHGSKSSRRSTVFELSPGMDRSRVLVFVFFFGEKKSGWVENSNTYCLLDGCASSDKCYIFNNQCWEVIGEQESIVLFIACVGPNIMSAFFFPCQICHPFFLRLWNGRFFFLDLV